MKADINLKPIVMLVLYSNAELESRFRYTSNVGAEDVYIEYAPIVNGKAGALIPLSNGVAGVLARQMGMKSADIISGYLTKNIIYASFDGIKPTMAWYTPPMKRRLLYSEDLGIQQATINTPGLIWVYKDYKVYVFAVKNEANADTKLYHAPFSNISDNGLVCLGGGTKIIDKQMNTFDSIMSKVELAFFGTKFSHQSNAGIKGNMMSLHKKLNGTDTPFPLDVLKPVKLTLSGFLNDKVPNMSQGEVFDDTNDDFDDDVDYEE